MSVLKLLSTKFFVAALVLCACSASALTLYRIELTDGNVVFAESAPAPSGTSFTFRSSPQGILMSLRRSEVARVTSIESLDKAPLDLGGSSLKRTVIGVPAIRENKSLPAARASASETVTTHARAYAGGDYSPGNRVAFPVARDDLLPGNYRPFPVGRGGQVLPPPEMPEGVGVPKSGLLEEPPQVILLLDPPASANMQVPAPPLVYAEKPRVDERVESNAVRRPPSAN